MDLHLEFTKFVKLPILHKLTRLKLVEILPHSYLWSCLKLFYTATKSSFSTKLLKKIKPSTMEPSPESMPLEPNIPQELIFHLLLRLPVKSLSRFKCVSKTWCSLLSSSEFIKSHLKISSEDNKFIDHRVLLPPQGSPRTLYALSLHEVGYGNSMIVNPVELDFPFQPLNGSVSFVGSINGLLCICLDSDGKLILWNPSIRKFKVLPVAASQFRTFGFGYDESTDDYKIVGFRYKPWYNLKTEVKIYSLKTNSFCKIHDYSDGHVSGHWLGKFVSGSLYWKAMRYNNSWLVDYIASFDIAAGTFGMISMPNCERFSHSLWSLEVLGGCLAVFHSDFVTKMDVYILKDHVEQKWTKLISIPYNNELRSFRVIFISSVFLFENGGILLSFGSNLVLYKDGEFYVKNRGPCNEGHAWIGNSCCTYFESLVSPNIGAEIAFSTDD